MKLSVKLKVTKYLMIAVVVICFANIKSVYAQDRIMNIENNLKSMVVEVPGLEQKVDISVNGTTIQEFVRGIAQNSNVNISIDPNLNINIVNNFTNVTVTDVLLFICKKYDLDITFIGNIISVSKYVPPTAPAPLYTPKKINVTYKQDDNSLSLDLKQDSLNIVIKEIIKVSGKNIIFSPDIKDKLLNGYILQVPFDNALDKLALSNDLKVTKTNDNFYLIEKKDAKPIDEKGQQGKGKKEAAGDADFDYKAENKDKISINAQNVPISNLVKEVSEKLKINYFLFSELKGNVSLNLTDISFDDLLKYLFRGTDYTFKKDSSIYLIGDRQLEGLRRIKVIQLQNRPLKDVMTAIPADIKKNVELKEFPDLNSLVASGSSPLISEIENFVRDIDKVVPIILIEVMVVDSKTSHTVTTGIKAGIGKSDVKTSGDLFPSLNLSLNSESINNLINSFNGYGIVNLGHVTPQFYASIQAMEDQSLIKIRSTPKLSTLNGHEAKLSIGTTEYYLETSNNVIGSQNPQNIITQQYKPTRADLAVTINPTVSGDDQVTLDIKVNQSTFSGRISPQAPPGQVSRDFSSLIRIRNGEMILLGGLEETDNNNTGSGVPLLSRIPVLKWLFSSRTAKRAKSKLNIFIKSTVIY
ncbi:MAG: hypothetical protein WC223_10975 [Bacteroidales bacterium]|jgi:type IV pilus assembly protein PilQ